MNLVHYFIFTHVNRKLNPTSNGGVSFAAIATPSFLDSALADAGLPPIPSPGGGALIKYLIANLGSIMTLIGQLVALFSAIA